ncbi:MAG: hypothetical protein L6V95_15715 [Candidatus Melainabacteria bacterium]|nr:MAG: hypothetical protein L6V95_15715 [Candidatus Melainabacteria bacterium]
MTPVLAQNAIKLLNFIGLNSTAHNLIYGRKIMAAGNLLGLDMSNFSIKSGIFADIRRIDKNMRAGIINGFKELPGNISKATIALKDWSIASIKGLPSNLMKGLIAFKNGFLGIPGMISKSNNGFSCFFFDSFNFPNRLDCTRSCRCCVLNL